MLVTERLILREFTTDDAVFALQLLNEPSFHKNIGDRGVRTLEQAQEYLIKGPIAMYREHGFGLWMAELKATGEPIGMCGLIKRPTLEDVDVGFAFLPTYWNKGYAYEAAAAAVKYGHEVKSLKRIVGIVSPHNVPSIRILEKLGMKFEKMITLAPGDTVMLFA